MTGMPRWTERLELRDEVVASDGSVGELQMSLGKVVYQTADVPYRNAEYWCDITEPTDTMVGVFASVARRLWSSSSTDATALFQFAQGMGGGKSHALVGMWHMARSPQTFFASQVGQRVTAAAQAGGRSLDFVDVHTVALCADQFSPGKASPLFGPAVTLFERFLWSLFPNDRATYDRLRGQGADKATVTEALRFVGKPVLVLIDELMDYVAAAASNEYANRLQSDEHQFLNSLFDACDDVPNVAVLLVMIRSDLDQHGYPQIAQDFREFLQSRVNRNGKPAPVSESKDFLSIIRRRLFVSPPDEALVSEAVAAFQIEVNDSWREQVFDRLPGGRNLTTVTNRLGAAYPFHPDLVSLVQDEWSTTVGFQRVRSTVRIFAATLLHWFQVHAAGDWVPPIVGIGDLPLNGHDVLDNILNSGLLLGTEMAMQGFANLASTDVISLSGTTGRAVDIDKLITNAGVSVQQPAPAVRMATTLFNLSLVNRAQGAKGATKAELLAAVWVPGMEFPAADEVLLRLTDPEEGLGSLEVDQPDNHRNRYWLSIKRTLQAVQKAARNQVQESDVRATVLNEIRSIANRHQTPFGKVIVLQDPGEHVAADQIASQIDEVETRLVVLDPFRWTLLNGRDSQTRSDINVLLGRGDHTVPHAASCVIATVNTQQRRYVEQTGQDVVAWKHVLRQLAESDEATINQVKSHLAATESLLRTRIQAAFRHYAFIAPGQELDISAEVQHRKFDDDANTSLRGDHVWTELAKAGRASQPGKFAPKILELLLTTFGRPLTPKEIVAAFYSDPRFPLVTTPEDITSAWDGLLGVGLNAHGGWQLEGGDGTVFGISGPGQVAINRMDATFVRVVEGETSAVDGRDEDADTGSGAGSGGSGAGGSVGPTPAGGSISPSVSTPLREYQVSLPSVSLGNVQHQKEVWRILSTLATRLDTASRATHDPQVIDLRITVTMRKTDLSSIQQAIDTIGKGSLKEEEPLA
jgi:hypothetical protein